MGLAHYLEPVGVLLDDGVVSLCEREDDPPKPRVACNAPTTEVTLHRGFYGRALRDLAGKQEGGLPQRRLQVERVQSGGGVFRDHHVEPP